MKEGTSPEVLKARESRGPRVGRVRGSGPCRGVIERPGGSRHDSAMHINSSEESNKDLKESQIISINSNGCPVKQD